LLLMLMINLNGVGQSMLHGKAENELYNE